MTANLQEIAQFLNASLDPRQNKQAELSLKTEEKKAGFTTALLQITAADDFPLATRLASALCFKNYVKWNWRDEEGNYKLSLEEVASIKGELIGLMIAVPPAVQNQLGEAISIIAESDFWEQWETLIDDLVARLTPDNAVTNNGILQISHSIFRRWRHLFRSDRLFTEINYVLSKFSLPFLTLLQNTDVAISNSKEDKGALQRYFTTLRLLVEIFYDLSSQDIPPFAEENLTAISTLLHRYLAYDNPLLHTDDDSESGILDEVKVAIFEVLVLYVQKYEEFFGPFVGQFVETSWTLLTTTGIETKHDILVSKALQFLSSIARLEKQAENFNSEQVLGQVIEGVILPNVTLRESDMELFEDEPIEFIRRDLEGSDNDTRRRAATDFLRQLLERFEKLVTDVTGRYINHYLSEYAANKTSAWKSKDTAVYLFSAIAAKGAVTSGQGVQTLNPYVDIVQFFQTNIAADLVSEDVIPLLKVDAIKYLYTFRSLIGHSYWQSAFPLVITHLTSSHYVVYTYASIAVERILYLSEISKTPIISRDDVVKSAPEILRHLFGLIQQEKVSEKIQENEFLMRCIMRVLIMIRTSAASEIDMLLHSFVSITEEVQKNPSNPRFYYYLFEAMGAVVRFATASAPEKIHAALYSAFSNVLSNDVQEFTPYAFQLFAAALEADPSKSVPNTYQNLVTPILLPPPWESKGNVPALVRFLSAVVIRDADDIVRTARLEPILGIFQKLVSSRSIETYAFELLDAVLVGIPKSALNAYFVPILQIMLSRLSNSKTENFAQQFTRFYHFFSATDDLGTDFFVSLADQVQNDVFRPIYTTVVLPETQKLARPLDRKTAVVSLTKNLAHSQAFVDRYPKGWALTCEALLKLLLNPITPQLTTDIGPEQDVDDSSFGVGFTPLTTCKNVPRDPFPDIKDVKSWVGECLKAADARHNGRISQYVQGRLSEQAQQALIAYMHS